MTRARRAASTAAVLTLFVAPIASMAACYAPTQMTLLVTTDVACAENPSTAIYTGAPFSDDPSAQHPGCEQGASGEGQVGSVTIVPSDDRDGRARVKVVLVRGGDPAQCNEKSSDCIVATRSFSFVEHRALRLPIRLRKECFGQLSCREGETCGPGGRCIVDEVTCTKGDCVLPGEEAIVAPSEAGAPEASAPNSCAGPNGTGILTTAPFAALPAPRATAFADGTFYFHGAGSGISKLFSVTTSGGEPLQVADLASDTLIDLAAAPSLGWAAMHANGNDTVVSIPSQNLALGNGQPGNAFRALTWAPSVVSPPFLYVTKDLGVSSIGAPPVTPKVESPSAGGTDIAVDTRALYVASVNGSQRYSRLQLDRGDDNGDLLCAESAAGRVFAKHADTVFAYGRRKSDAGLEPIILEMKGLEAPGIVATPEKPVVSLAADETSVYWTDAKDIWQVPRNANTPRLIRSSPTNEKIGHLVVDGGCVYFWSLRAGENARLRVIPAL